jgi:hypothetical protein
LIFKEIEINRSFEAHNESGLLYGRKYLTRYQEGGKQNMMNGEEDEDVGKQGPMGALLGV